MKKVTVAAIAIVVLALLLTGLWYAATPLLKKREYIKASDAGSGKTEMITVDVAGDEFSGYDILRSPLMRENLLARGILLKFHDDKGDYPDRLARFSQGEYDLIVLPVSSYLEHGKGWPGVILGGISESKDADAIVGRKDKFGGGSLKTLDDPTVRIAYARDTPSEFLINAVIAHFGLESLQNTGGWRVETATPEEALRLLNSKQVDVAVLWEPFVSQALENPENTVIFGSGGVRGLIVDAFVAPREDLVKEKPREILGRVMEAYFVTFLAYSMDRDRFISDVAELHHTSKKQAAAMIEKLDLLDLQENAGRYFGISTGGAPASEGMVSTILACADVMTRTGTPLAGKLDNPYELTNASIIEQLVRSMPQTIGEMAHGVDFAPLAESEWGKLKELGALRIEPITFQSGIDLLDQAGKESVDAVASMLVNNYPGYRVVVRGHTAPGDEQVNLELSRARAETVVQYLTVVHDIDPDRLRAEGLGSTQPLKARPGESQRSLRMRLPRVEFVLVQGNDL